MKKRMSNEYQEIDIYENDAREQIEEENEQNEDDEEKVCYSRRSACSSLGFSSKNR